MTGTTKKIWVGSNWKMYKTQTESVQFCEAMCPVMEQISEHIQPFVIPSITSVQAVSALFRQKNSRCLTGVQNMYPEEEGPYTGEISPRMVAETGAVLVEIGHSERRQWFHETDELVNRKTLAALNHHLRPLICVGDQLFHKQSQCSAEIVAAQVKAALLQVSQEQMASVLIAYEPVWAIGEHGIPAKPEHAQQIHAAIRQALTELYDAGTAAQTPLLYGGSVNLTNYIELIQQNDIDGLFVGRAAWTIQGFSELLRNLDQRFHH